jgi:hypothetical protein
MFTNIKMLKFQSYSIKNLLLTNKVLEVYINKFWDDIFSPLVIGESKYLMIMCKVDFTNSGDNELGGYRCLGHLRKVNFDDKKMFIEYLISRLGILTDSYITIPISKITFTYIIKDGVAPDNRALLNPDLSDKITNHRFNNMNLPISMEPSDYGDVIVDNHQIQTTNKDGLGITLFRYIIKNGNRLYRIDMSEDRLINYVSIEGVIDLSWTDTKITSEAGSLLFKRDIGKSSIYFLDGIRILRKKTLKFKPFLNESTNKTLDSNFITMDIETIKINSKLPHLKIFPF